MRTQGGSGLAPVRAGRGFAAALGSALLSACGLWTSGPDGDALRSRASDHETRIAAIEASVEEDRAALNGELETARSRLGELESVLTQATALVTRNSADTGAQVEVLAAQLAAQEGTIAELRGELERLQAEFGEMERDYSERMKKLARRAGLDVEMDASEIPSSPDDLYRAATAAYEGREFASARALFRAFVTRHGADARAAAAQYFVGQSYLLEDRPATALGELRRVVADFASSDRVPYALLSMGEAFWRLHACDEARSALETLTTGFPRAPNVGEARTRLREFRSPPRGYCAEPSAAGATP
jgi:TolA-binding protein